ncbi:Aldo/keto reductase [Artomyces pyxidatus]|uniref:Aldo/keto reductase n=1 Tax=Artomyces pyxidatus TaxID=48021 RepID=A0ACB8SQP6_9AGAM|nr:Aldo/keto reductase [Artomyces pyxidatus]
MAADIPAFTLNDGTKMPAVGMGCWMGGFGGGARVSAMVKKALEVGYRHFDTASGYGNEEQVGAALRESGIPREQLYVVTKLGGSGHHRVEEAFEESLAKLGIEYVDLYLMHWPQGDCDGRTLQPEDAPTFIDTWKDMEKLLGTGKVKSIGVSNFSIKTLTELLPHCKIVPAVNQVEAHPFLPQVELKNFCEDKGILITAYSPLGRPPSGQPPTVPTEGVPSLLSNSTVVGITEKYKVTPAQVLLSWGVQRGTPVIPKSENEERMRANITLLHLDETDMKVLDTEHTKPGLHRSLMSYHSTIGGQGSVFGWTYEQMGWNLAIGGVVP